VNSGQTRKPGVYAQVVKKTKERLDAVFLLVPLSAVLKPFCHPRKHHEYNRRNKPAARIEL
jgi:hypothetical protein